jgi:hypothetical protein
MAAAIVGGSDRGSLPSREDDPMASNSIRSTGSPAAAADALNDRFHELLREAAARRAERALAQSAGDSVAARQELAEILALARGDRGEQPPRGRPVRPR